MSAGNLDTSVLFQSPVAGNDGYGNQVTGGWADEFSRLARTQFLKGGEAVLASRLEGRQPAVLTVGADSGTARITPEWRCKIAGRVFNIREMPRLSNDRDYLEFLIESGVAT